VVDLLGCSRIAWRKARREGWGLQGGPVDGGFLATRSLGGETVGLDVSSGTPEIVTRNGRRTAVTSDELVAFQIDGGLPRMVARLSEAEPNADSHDGFDTLRAEVPAGFSVLLDTTTVRNAMWALESDTPSPLALLDLATLSTAVVCFDNVLVQPFDAEIAAAPEVGIRVLTQSRELIEGPLWNICGAAGNQLSGDDQRRQSLEAAWAEFLGWPVEDARLDAGAWDHYQDSPRAWDGIVAGHYADALFEVGATGKSTAAFLGIQTMRTMVNYELASRLGLPYLAASLRSPVQCLIIRENHQRQLLVDRLMQALGPSPAEPGAKSDSPYAQEYSAPFILALVLERMRQPGDYWSIVAEYRARFRPLREFLQKDQATWDGRTAPYVRQMLQRVGATSRLMDEGEKITVDAGAAMVAGALGGVAGASASLSMKLISLLKPTKHAQRCYYRWFRPELYLLTSLQSEAEKLRAIDTRVEKIWKCRWDQRHYRQLGMLRAGNPAPFLKLGELR
jgi:hypothetical protein